jgi:hypothetical protein
VLAQQASNNKYHKRTIIDGHVVYQPVRDDTALHVLHVRRQS